METKWYGGLAFRYVLHLCIVGLALSVLLIWNASIQQKRNVMHEMEHRASLLAESLASACGSLYLVGDVKAVEFALARASRIQDVSEIRLLDAMGKVEVQVPKSAAIEIPDFFKIQQGSVWRSSDSMYAAAPLVVQRLKDRDILGVLSEDAAARQPRSEFVLGYVVAKFSLTRAEELVQSLILRSMLATLALILMVSLLTFFFFRKEILKPIRRLIEAMVQVRRGNLTMSIESGEPGSEVGILTNTFNAMTQDLMKAEDDLRRANSELERRVSDRTRDLEKTLHELKETQEKVVRSEKLATIGQLASGVGHELRNPLGAVRNALYYIRDVLKDSAAAKEDPSLMDFVRLAEREVNTTTNIVNDLLDFSRVMILNLRPSDLNAIIAELKSVVKVPKNVEWKEDPALNLPPVEIDPDRLRQVFINLATNAIQAMPKGGILTIATRLEKSDPPQWVEVLFQDTGAGIAPNVLPKIFEPLFTTKPKGTGLGLAICQGIVEKHGGKILVESHVGRGTTFQVRLPLKNAQKAPERNF